MISSLGLVLVLAACSAYATTAPSQATTAPVQATTAPVSGATSAPGSAVAVAISGYAFDPATLTVKEGTTVTWTNQDSVTHTVTSDTGLFDSGGMSQGDTFSFTFTTAGTYAYHCTPHHASMNATIIVTK